MPRHGDDDYNPGQPRVPAGRSTGGQWTRGGSIGDDTRRQPSPNEPSTSDQLAARQITLRDDSGKELWHSKTESYASNGRLAEEVYFNRDGTEVCSQYPTSKSDKWDLRHRIRLATGAVFTVENDGPDQFIYDAHDNLLSAAPRTEKVAMGLSGYCRVVKSACIAECSESKLPTYNFGWRWVNCYNACMRRHGCDPHLATR
jgi:hypothetical protein